MTLTPTNLVHVSGLRSFFFFVLWAIVATCGMWSALIHMDAVDQVNKQLPASEQIPVLFPGLHKTRTRAEYARLFPTGNHFDKQRVLITIGFTALVCLAVAAFAF
jgi:hypothetical protein